jgi:hypothetical protein
MFKEKETETQKDQINHSRSHSWYAAEISFQLVCLVLGL